jgi:serine/threonine protein kinase
LYGYNFKVSDGEQFLVLEYAANGSLDRFLMNKDKMALLLAGTRLSIMYQVARAVNCLHTGASGFIVFHRDIKSANICLTNDFTPRLIDCGVAKFVEDEHNAFPSDSIKQTSTTQGHAFGTKGYICPEYSWKMAQAFECDFEPAYDVYSFGVVIAELILGSLNNGNPTNVLQTYVQNGETPIVDGWTRLKKDADGQANWDPDALEVVCLTAMRCITPSSLLRLSMKDLLDLLHHAENIHAEKSVVDPVGERVVPPRKKSDRGTGDISALLSKIRLKTGKGDSEPEGSATGLCVACNLRDPVVTCRGESHPLCANCMEDAVWNAPSNTTAPFQLSCLKLGCTSEPFTDKEICDAVTDKVWNFYLHKRNEKGFNQVKALQKNTIQDVNEMKDMVKKLASVVDSHLPGWVLENANAEKLKQCPTVVVLTRIAVDRSKDLKTWFTKLGKQKYNVVFYCEHSGDPGHEPFEITVDKNWIVNVAPWLRIVVNIGAAWDKTKVLTAIIKEFPLHVHTKGMKDLIDALGKEEKHGEKQTLQGGALDAIAEMANQEENLKKWRDKMEPVRGENGRTMWVKRTLEDENGDGLWS